MGSVVWIGFAAFFVASLTVGVRLILLSRRTRELPELLIGIGVLGIGPVGFGLVVIAEALRSQSPNLAMAMYAIALAAVAGGAFAKYVFNWQVYYPKNQLAQVIVWAAGGGLLTAWITDVIQSGFHNPYDLTPQYLVRSGLQVGCLLWGSAEAFRYWTKMRRRQKLGLADPIITNRFMLWGIGAGAAGMGSAIGVVVQSFTGLSLFEVPWLMMSSSMHGLIAAIAMWLAFLPPARYLEYMRSGAVDTPS